MGGGKHYQRQLSIRAPRKTPRKEGGPKHTPFHVSVDRCVQKLGMQCSVASNGFPEDATNLQCILQETIHDQNPTESVITSLGGSKAPQEVKTASQWKFCFQRATTVSAQAMSSSPHPPSHVTLMLTCRWGRNFQTSVF